MLDAGSVAEEQNARIVVLAQVPNGEAGTHRREEVNWFWKIVGWIVWGVVLICVVLFFVFIGHLVGIDEVVSAAVALGVMITQTTADMKDQFKKTDKSLDSICERLTLIESRLDDIQDSLRPDFDE